MPSASYAQYPYYLSPLNAECYYRFTSPDYNLPNWRYYAELYRYAPNTTTNPIFVGRYKVAPRPNTGDGLFTPHKILKEFLKFNIQVGANRVVPDPNMAMLYALKKGFGWNPKLTYGSNTSTGALRGTVIPSSQYSTVVKPQSFTFGPGTYYYLRLATTTAHGLAVGDQIYISKRVKGYHPYYDGPCTVRQVLTSTFIEVNVLYSGLPNVVGSPNVNTGNISTYVESGDIIDAVRMDSALSGIRVGWHGTRQYNQNNFDFITKYTVVANNQVNYTTYNWLTPFPHATKWKKIYRNQRETVNFIYMNTGTAAQIQIKLFNTNNVLIGTIYKPIPQPITAMSYQYYTMETGWENLLTASEKNIFAATRYYSVHFGIGSLVSIGAKYELINRDCHFDNVRLCWLNKLGGYDYFNFSKKSIKTISVEKTPYKKQLEYNYVIGDRYEGALVTNAEQSWEVNTDWVEEHEYNMLCELISSPDVYLIDDFYADGTSDQAKYPVIITDTSHTLKTKKNDKLVMMNVSFKLARPDNIQAP